MKTRRVKVVEKNSLREKAKNIFRAFLRAKRQAAFNFAPKAYYITMGDTLVSPVPYFSWKKARAAAKRFHRRAFFQNGRTLERKVLKGGRA